MPPAARLTDMHTCPMVTGIVPHVGGPILPPCAPTVLIGFLPAARVTDMCTCVGPPDMIAKGSPTVLTAFMMQARMGDLTAHGGVIVLGCPTVIVGEAGSGGGGGGGGGGASGPSAAAAAPATAQQPAPAADPAAPPSPAPAPAPAAAPSNGPFDTQDDAAKAALTTANPQSVQANKEFGGVIYQDSNGKYFYSGPAQGTDQGFNPSQAPAPADTTVVGDYHTHGDYSTADPTTGAAVRTSDPAHDDFNSDNFSSTDKTGIAGDGAGKPNYSGYLGTPSGTFRKYTPATGTDAPF